GNIAVAHHRLHLLQVNRHILVKKIKPDFKKLGAKHGKMMKQIAAAINAMSQHDINALESAGTFTLNVDSTPVEVLAEEVTIVSEDIPGWLVANEGRVTVALDITVTPELRAEGIARELINRIQNIRKGRDYNITDRVNVIIEDTHLTADALRLHSDYIATQVLARSLTAAALDNVAEDEILDIDGDTVKVSVKLA
ncbi:MAG: isoleucine--tRNA ligase, partial [Muribaculaceae bacterium]|nr:isoleucine--tRNA ligase [Muribaculaceae bacterium]